MMSTEHEGGGPQIPIDPSDRTIDILKKRVEKNSHRYLASKEAIGMMASAYNCDKQEWLEILDLLKTHKLDREIKKDIVTRARLDRSAAGVATPAEGDNDVSVRETLKQIKGVPEVPFGNTAMPLGYRLRPNGSIQKEVQKNDGSIAWTTVVSVPTFVSKIFLRRGTEAYEVEVTWLRGKRWKRRTIKRNQMSIPRQLAEVSEFGLPVINAALLAEYLVNFEQANLSKLKHAYTIPQLGWLPEDRDPIGLGFMAGSEFIRNPNAPLSEEVALSAELNKVKIASRVRARGSLDKWCEALGHISDKPSVRIAIYAALASPLLSLFDWPNGVLEWASPTSEGKSTVIQFLMSAWQSPNDDIPIWHTTGVGLERTAAAMSSVYLAIDDTATAGPQSDHRNTVQSAIYMLVAGTSKVRGTSDGSLQDMLSWRLLAVTSGEVPTGELGGAEGSAARILSITNKPLGDVTEETGAKIMAAKDGMREHFGTAGPAVVRWLMANRDAWPEIKQRYDDTFQMVSKAARSGPGNRAAHVIALLDASATVAHRAIDLPWLLESGSMLSDPEIRSMLETAVVESISNSNKTGRVYEHLMSFHAENPDRFWDSADEYEKRQPNGGWVGRAYPDSDTIDFHTGAFKELCNKWKLGERVVLRSLAAMGKLETKEGRNGIQERVGSQRLYFYKVVK